MGGAGLVMTWAQLTSIPDACGARLPMPNVSSTRPSLSTKTYKTPPAGTNPAFEERKILLFCKKKKSRRANQQRQILHYRARAGSDDRFIEPAHTSPPADFKSGPLEVVSL